MVRFNPRQEKQIRKQLKAHGHQRYEVDIKLAEGHYLEGFIVNPNVMRPEIMTSLHLARWLFYNNGLYKGKDVLDMGSGTGIQGVVMGLYGARSVCFSELSDSAGNNSWENIAKFGLENYTMVASDLFEVWPKHAPPKFGLIVFNHPFFDYVLKDNDRIVLISMLGGGGLIHRFLGQAKDHLDKDGKIIMPYFHLAGPENNPAVQGPKHSYSVLEKFAMESRTGLQQGPISIYELSRR